MQPVAERGGSDQALLRLVRSLPRDEFDFHIAVPGPSPLAAEFAAAGATLHIVPMERLSTSHDAGTWARYVAGWPLALLFALLSVLLWWRHRDNLARLMAGALAQQWTLSGSVAVFAALSLVGSLIIFLTNPKLRKMI